MSIQIRPIGPGREISEASDARGQHEARRGEQPADVLVIVVFLSGKNTVGGVADVPGQLERGIDLGRACQSIVRGRADASRVDELSVRRRAQIEQRLILGEEGPLVGEDGFDRGEIDDQLIALHLPEVGIDRCRQLHIARGSPGEIDSGAGVRAVLDQIAQRRDVRRRIEVAFWRRSFDVDLLEIGQQRGVVVAQRGTRVALVAVVDPAIEIDPDGMARLGRVAHVDGLPGNEHLDMPFRGGLGDRMHPATVPVVRELVLIDDQPVARAAAQAHRELIAGLAAAVEIDHEADRVAEQDFGVARRLLANARQGVGLLDHECDGQPLGRGDHARLGRVLRIIERERIGPFPARAGIGIRAGPFGLIENTVDHNGRAGIRTETQEQRADGKGAHQHGKRRQLRPRHSTFHFPVANGVTRTGRDDSES